MFLWRITIVEMPKRMSALEFDIFFTTESYGADPGVTPKALPDTGIPGAWSSFWEQGKREVHLGKYAPYLIVGKDEVFQEFMNELGLKDGPG